MRLTMEGASRYHGTHELFDDSLLARGKVFTVEKSKDTERTLGVSINRTTTVRLGGEYRVRAMISKEEIAKLFYETHKDEIDAFAKCLPSIRRM